MMRTRKPFYFMMCLLLLPVYLFAFMGFRIVTTEGFYASLGYTGGFALWALIWFGCSLLLNWRDENRFFLKSGPHLQTGFFPAFLILLEGMAVVFVLKLAVNPNSKWAAICGGRHQAASVLFGIFLIIGGICFIKVFVKGFGESDGENGFVWLTLWFSLFLAMLFCGMAWMIFVLDIT